MKTLHLRALALVPTALLAASFQAPAEEQTAAVLKLREVNFHYRSAVAVFSCPDLENRVASIIRGLGARDDVDVEVVGCNAFYTPGEQHQDMSDSRQNSSFDWNASASAADPYADRYGNRYATRDHRDLQSTHVRIRAMLPVEVTPEILKEMEKDKARRELVSRVTGNPAAGMNDPIVFPAERRVVLLSRKTADLDPEECELVEQMAQSVFRKLDMKVVRGRPNCDRNRISHIPLKMEVEALMPVMPKAPQILPPEGSTSEPDPAATPPAEPAQHPAEGDKPQ
jgi:hypothetical protein